MLPSSSGEMEFHGVLAVDVPLSAFSEEFDHELRAFVDDQRIGSALMVEDNGLVVASSTLHTTTPQVRV